METFTPTATDVRRQIQDGSQSSGAIDGEAFDRMLEAERQSAREELLNEMLLPESLEASRLRIEDELVEWRDSSMFTMRRNGLAIASKDGTPSSIIRFGFEQGLSIILHDRLKKGTSK